MSNIEWTDETWNPVIGCTPVSPGCLNCYAAGMARRLEGMQPKVYGPRRRDAEGRDVTGLPGLECETDRSVRIAEVKAGRAVFTGEVRTLEDRLTVPLRWREPRRVFVNSMSDLFHEAVPFEFIDRVFAVMALCPWHTFQVLTKRPERMREYVNGKRHQSLGPIWKAIVGMNDVLCEDRYVEAYSTEQCFGAAVRWPLPNVWLGTSVENQACVKRVWELLKTPAAVRFVSVEPLIGPVDLNKIDAMCSTWRNGLTVGTYLDWVIVGGESGPNARPCDVNWVRDVVEQCKGTDTPVFVKQMGSRPILGSIHETGFDWPKGTRVGTFRGGPYGRAVLLKDRKGGDMAEWPEDLRVRQWPRVGAVSK